MNTRDSWKLIDPLEGIDTTGLPELWIQFDNDLGGRFTVRTGRWPNRTEINAIELEGRIAGSVEFTSVHIESDGLSTDTLRAIPIGRLRSAIAATIRRDPDRADVRARIAQDGPPDNFTKIQWEQLEKGAEAGIEAAHAAKEQIRSTGRRPGAPPLTDERLRLVAETYLTVHQEGPTRVAVRVTERLAQLLNRPDLKKPTVSYWISQARKRGWLEATTKGMTTALPGPRLKEWREEHGTS